MGQLQAGQTCPDCKSQKIHPVGKMTIRTIDGRPVLVCDQRGFAHGYRELKPVAAQPEPAK